MPTIARVHGLLIMIYPVDHEPPHFHAWGRGIELRLAIAEGEIRSERGKVTSRDRRLLPAWARENREALMKN